MMEALLFVMMVTLPMAMAATLRVKLRRDGLAMAATLTLLTLALVLFALLC